MTTAAVYSVANVRRVELEARRLRAEAMKEIFGAIFNALGTPFRAVAKLGGKQPAHLA
ncbi:MAG: hypothetical protein O2824_03965 [Proteobacteria bacterium]|nr:hypothetical protein [Pseudomonadota bacterium]